MRLILIAAIARNNVIGVSTSSLPWHIRDEMQFFKSIITNRWHLNPQTHGLHLRPSPNVGKIAYIMGRNTYNAMPPITSSIVVGRLHHPTVDKAIEHARHHMQADTVFVLGGSRIYDECLRRQLCHRLIISRIHNSYDGDIFMPPINTQKYRLETTFAFSPHFNIEQWTRI